MGKPTDIETRNTPRTRFEVGFPAIALRIHPIAPTPLERVNLTPISPVDSNFLFQSGLQRGSIDDCWMSALEPWLSEVEAESMWCPGPHPHRGRHRVQELSMWKTFRSLAILGVIAGGVALSSSATAAEFTDVLDAADDKDDYSEETYDPFDFNLEPSFSYETGKAEITREAPCVNASSADEWNSEFGDDDLAKSNPRVEYDPERCVTGSGDSGTVENKEMLYRHQEARLDIKARVGLYKDLELHLNAPVVLSESNAMKYANESGDSVDGSNSWVDPDDSRIESDANDTFGGTSRSDAPGLLNQYKTHRYFELGDEFSDSEYTRSGFDDPSIGIMWGPYNGQRDDTKATMVLGMDYIVPIAKIRKADNPDAVGDGMHKLEWTFGASKQFDWIDPYFGMQYMLQIPSRGSPIKELKEIDEENDGQAVTQPPQKGEISIGTEFVPHEVKTPDEHERYAIDLNFTFGYTSEGRDYSPLYDHMVGSQCNGDTFSEVTPNYDSNGNYSGPGGVECSWLAQRPANVQPDPVYNLGSIDGDQELQTNGIMTVESYATFAGQLGFYLQPTRYFQFKLLGGITHQQEHFLTNARTGSDVSDDREATADDQVDLTGEDAAIERNPAYNSTYDSPGTRFRVSEFNTWNVMATMALQF